MNKAEIIARTAKEAGITKKDAEKAINALLASIEESLLRGEKVQFVGFGSFTKKTRAARMVRNPQKPDEMIEVEAKKVPVFKPGKLFLQRLNFHCTLGPRPKKKK